MSSKPLHVARKNGVFFTPEPLARLLCEGVIDRPGVSVLDPACGEGALLSAAEARCASLLHNKRSIPELYGCDRLTHKGFPQQDGNWHFVKQDFFGYEPKRKFDVVVMNPPFLAANRISEAQRRRYRAKCNGNCQLAYNVDVWVYFLIKSVGHLRTDGNLGAILPWSFLQADYATSVRRWLAERFGSAKIHVITADHFQRTNKRVLLVCLKGYGRKLDAASIGFSEHLEAPPHHCNITRKQWIVGPASIAHGRRVEGILEKCRRLPGVQPLGEIAKVSIGIVTGANGFFVMVREEAHDLGFRRGDLVSILSSGEELKTLKVSSRSSRNVLLQVPTPVPKHYERYLAKGRREKVHLRSHSLRRNPWYVVNPGETPDAFFHYRASIRPFLVLNRGGLQCTNSIHRLYFKHLTESKKRWVQVSLISTLGQLSLELHGRTYGNGVLKIEPKCLKQALVFLGSTPMPAAVYRDISGLLSRGRKCEAEQKATALIQEAAGIPEDLARDVSLALQELRSRRLPESGAGV